MKKYTLSVALFLLVGLSLASQQKTLGIGKVAGSMRGTTFRVVQAALPALEEKSLDLGRYMITVYEHESSYVVAFTDPDKPADVIGGSPNFLEYEVDISKKGLRVLRAHYVR